MSETLLDLRVRLQRSENRLKIVAQALELACDYVGVQEDISPPAFTPTEFIAMAKDGGWRTRAEIKAEAELKEPNHEQD